MMHADIRLIADDTFEENVASLVELLRNVVNNGASIGFIRPLGAAEAEAYWRAVLPAVAAGDKLLWGAYVEGVLAGSVQMYKEPRPNGRHRCEVQKAMVHTGYRRLGLARRLMQALEEEAVNQGRWLLYLDTRRGDPAEQLYGSLNFQIAGTIPQYALNDEGGADDTVYYYKLLK